MSAAMDNAIDAAIASGLVVYSDDYELCDRERLRLKRLLPWAVVRTPDGFDVVEDVGPDYVEWVSRWRTEDHARADAELRETELREHFRTESEEDEE